MLIFQVNVGSIIFQVPTLWYSPWHNEISFHSTLIICNKILTARPWIMQLLRALEMYHSGGYRNFCTTSELMLSASSTMLWYWKQKKKIYIIKSQVSLKTARIRKSEAKWQISIYSNFSPSSLHVDLNVFSLTHTDAWFPDCFSPSLCSLSASAPNTCAYTHVPFHK